MGDMKQVPFCGPTNTRRHFTKFGQHGYLAPRELNPGGDEIFRARPAYWAIPKVKERVEL
jgi:hypothetical protein